MCLKGPSQQQQLNSSFWITARLWAPVLLSNVTDNHWNEAATQPCHVSVSTAVQDLCETWKRTCSQTAEVFNLASTWLLQCVPRTNIEGISGQTHVSGEKPKLPLFSFRLSAPQSLNTLDYWLSIKNKSSEMLWNRGGLSRKPHCAMNGHRDVEEALVSAAFPPH